MAASDARPVPRKNVAFRVYFPIVDADGDLVTGAAGLDSEVSKDGAAYADCTNEATEIGTSGTYFLDLTSTEMNADAVVVIVKTSTSGAKTSPIFLYPEEIGDFRASAESLSATAQAEVLAQAAAALTATVADSVPADGTRPSIAQGILMLVQFLCERAVSGTTCTVKKPDGSTTLFTLTLNSSSAPTSITRAT